jgi:hypothetical protein
MVKSLISFLMGIQTPISVTATNELATLGRYEKALVPGTAKGKKLRNQAAQASHIP